MKKLLCSCIVGNDALPIDVETNFVRGLPSFAIVGLGGNAIQESRERIKSALSSMDFKFPPQKVTVNLSPSDIKKEGSHFDLGIAVSIAMQSSDVVFRPDICILGELGLDGVCKDTSLIFALVLSLLQKHNITKFIIPKGSLEKLSHIPNIELCPVSSLQNAIEILQNQENIEFITNATLKYKNITINDDKYYYDDKFELDFVDVYAQERAKKASLIAAAGMHNIIYEGSPGCGKSMCAKRLPYIMPPVDIDEILSHAKTKSLNNQEVTFSPTRAFRSPHHTSSRPSIFGGGSANSRIGEIALANNGVMFFDELPHFHKSILESLREPLEDHTMLISRVQNKIKYDTKILFIGACNPCPCGNLFSSINPCRCNEMELKRYQNKLSDALIDRIDIYVKMQDIDLTKQKPTTTSAQMHQSVIQAFVRQKQRGQKELNGKLSDTEIQQYCQIDDDTNSVLNNALNTYGLSLRSKNKILKVARTIADLDGNTNITKSHILEAMSYRR